MRPRAVKIAVVVGGIGLGLAGALGMQGVSTLYSLSLSLFQLAGFAICTWLLATRDRTTLMGSENRSIGRLAVGALVVIPFIVSDFQVLTPDIPVRLGALGALLVVTAVVIAGGGAQTRRQGFLLTALRLAVRCCSAPLPPSYRRMSTWHGS